MELKDTYCKKELVSFCQNPHSTNLFMITVHICGEEKTLQEVDTDWITRVLNRNRIQENPICVKVDIHGNSTNLKLATPNCEDFVPAKGKNEIENRIIFLWEEIVLSQSDIFAAHIYDFLTRMEQWVSFVPKKVSSI